MPRRAPARPPSSSSSVRACHPVNSLAYLNAESHTVEHCAVRSAARLQQQITTLTEELDKVEESSEQRLEEMQVRARAGRQAMEKGVEEGPATRQTPVDWC